MSFFSRIKRLASGHNYSGTLVNIFAPISGTIIPIEDVPDEIFSNKIVGDGIAILPSGKYIYSPIDGKIGKIFESNHAFSIESNSGIEIFVHFGINTIELLGNGFKRLAHEGQEVKVGEPIIQFDLDFLIQNVECLYTPIIVANIEDIDSIIKSKGEVIATEDVILTVKI